MVSARHEIVIDRPLEEVFAFFEDHENHPKWQHTLVDHEREPLRNGAKVTEIHNFLGRRVELHGEVIDFEKNQGFGFRGQGPSVKSITYHNHFERAGAGTRVRANVEMEPQDMLGVARPLIEKVMQRDLEHSFELLKDVLEQKEHATHLHQNLPKHAHQK